MSNHMVYGMVTIFTIYTHICYKNVYLLNHIYSRVKNKFKSEVTSAEPKHDRERLGATLTSQNIHSEINADVKFNSCSLRSTNKAMFSYQQPPKNRKVPDILNS